MTLRRISPTVIFWASWCVSMALFLYPFDAREGFGLGLDKVAHFIIFATLGFYGIRSYRENIHHTLVLLAVYALGIEYVQGKYLPGRMFDWYDAVAGIIGLTVIFLHHKNIRR